MNSYLLEGFPVLILELVLTSMDLNSNIKNKIRTHAERFFPEECCGFLIESDQGDVKVIECKNVSEEKETLFKISIDEYLQALTEGDIYAVYHSHTKGENSFSDADKTVSESLELVSILYNTSNESFEILEPEIEDE